MSAVPEKSIANGNNNADRHIEYTERVGQERAEYDTEKGEDVALDSENRKENGVLYQLRKTKVKGYHHEVNVHPHHGIKDEHAPAYKQEYEHHGTAIDVEIEKYNVKYKHEAEECVDNAVNQPLAEITFNSGKEIRPEENRLLAHHGADEAGAAHIDKPEGEDEQHRKTQKDL